MTRIDDRERPQVGEGDKPRSEEQKRADASIEADRRESAALRSRLDKLSADLGVSKDLSAGSGDKAADQDPAADRCRDSLKNGRRKADVRDQIWVHGSMVPTPGARVVRTLRRNGCDIPTARAGIATGIGAC